jgi:hypothetical protein
VLSGGDPSRYPATMIWLNLLSLLAIGVVLSTEAQRRGLTAAAGWLVVLIPGFWTSMDAGLPEPLAAVALLGGVIAAMHSRTVIAGLLFGCSLLVRETGAVLVIALAVSIGLTKSWRHALLLGVLALGPVAVWRAYVGLALMHDWGWEAFFGQPADFGWPFRGFADMWRTIRNGEYYGGNSALALAGTTYPILLTASLAVAAALVWTERSAVAIAAFCYALIAVSLNFKMIWVYVGNGQRGTYEVFLALAIASLGVKQFPRPLKAMIVLFWCAAGWYVFYGSVESTHIKTALGLPV